MIAEGLNNMLKKGDKVEIYFNSRYLCGTLEEIDIEFDIIIIKSIMDGKEKIINAEHIQYVDVIERKK